MEYSLHIHAAPNAQVASNQVKADQQVLGFVSNLARAFEYVGDAAQLKAIVRSLGDNIDKLLNLVTTSCIVILKYVRYSFAGKPRLKYTLENF